MTRTTNNGVKEWLTVGEACALIGVSPATLRRWTANGEVLAFTTPGGHRRFARSALLARLPSGPRQRPPTLRRLGETSEHVTRVCQRHLAKAGGGLWLHEVDGGDRDLLRAHGRAIATALLTHIDAVTVPSRQEAIGQAAASAAACGRIAARRDAGLRPTVETFLRFRRMFLRELVEVARRRGFNTVEATELLVTADGAFDRLLTALLTGYETRAAEETP